MERTTQLVEEPSGYLLYVAQVTLDIMYKGRKSRLKSIEQPATINYCSDPSYGWGPGCGLMIELPYTRQLSPLFPSARSFRCYTYSHYYCVDNDSDKKLG